jgi:hypothetical protein
MEPLIINTKGLLGERIHFNYVTHKKNFLLKGVDLSPEVFGKPLDSYFYLARLNLRPKKFNPKENLEKAKFIIAEVQKQNLLCKLKKSNLEAYYYFITETNGVEILFTARFITGLTKQSREEWADSLNLTEYNCCFRNYYDELKLNIDFKSINPNQVIANASVLDERCSYKQKHVEVNFSIWAYIINNPTLEQVRSLRINFPLQNDRVLGGLPTTILFAFGSHFKTKHEQERDKKTPFGTGVCDINCKYLYSCLNNETNFSSFVVDSLNNVSYHLSQFRNNKHPQRVLSFQFLGCSFIFNS